MKRCTYVLPYKQDNVIHSSIRILFILFFRFFSLARRYCTFDRTNQSAQSTFTNHIDSVFSWNMLTNMQFSSIEQLNDSQYFRTPLPVQNSYHRLHASTLVNSTCSAYFITRVDLNDYTLDTLKQIVDRNVSGPKSKGRTIKQKKEKLR